MSSTRNISYIFIIQLNQSASSISISILHHFLILCLSLFATTTLRATLLITIHMYSMLTFSYSELSCPIHKFTIFSGGSLVIYETLGLSISANVIFLLIYFFLSVPPICVLSHPFLTCLPFKGLLLYVLGSLGMGTNTISGL